MTVDPSRHGVPAQPQAMADVFDEVRAERARAHALHGDTSMEASPPDTLRRLAILTEEVGEVAKEFNEAEHHGRPVDLLALRKELIQVAAMAGAWADACGRDDRVDETCPDCGYWLGGLVCLTLCELSEEATDGLG